MKIIYPFLTVFLLLACQLPSSGQVINTFAGTGEQGYSGDGGQAIDAQFSNPYDLTIDASDNMYIVDNSNHRIRKVDASTGVITTVAGTGIAGFSGDGGQATSAQLNGPSGIAVDGSGNLYIADLSNHRIRKVEASTGVITTVAGTGYAGYFNGDGIQATSAYLNTPYDVGVDDAGNIYIVDHNHLRIRKVDASTGVITTVAGNGSAGFSGDEGQATSAQINYSFSIAVEGSGTFYFADSYNNRIRKVDASTGVITTVAGSGSAGFSGDEGLASSAQLNQPRGVVLDGSGNIYIADTYNQRYRKVEASTGMITTVVGNGSMGYSGDGGLATSAQVAIPSGAVAHGTDTLYITDNNRIRIIAPDETAPSGYSVAFDASFINAASESSVSFTLSDGETQATYEYVISSDGGEASLTGSGTVSTASEQINGIDVSTLSDGLLTLSVTLTDPSGNTGTAVTATVMKDTALPTVLTKDINVVLDASGNGSITTAAIDNGSYDASGIASMTLDQTIFSCADLGQNTVTLTLTDEFSNSASASATVTILDETAPIADMAELPNITAECAVTVSQMPTATDNCSGSITATTTDALTYSEQGSYTIHWSYEDANGNVTTQTQQVIIEDINAPVFTCLENITFSSQDVRPSLALTDVSDNCDAAPAIRYELSGATTGSGNGELSAELLEIGLTTVTYTVTDASGNAASCSFDVQIDQVLSTQEAVRKEVRLYPNPTTSGFVKLELPEGYSQVRILNMTGQQVYYNQKAQSTLRLELSEFVQGLYFVELNGKAGQQVIRLLIQN